MVKKGKKSTVRPTRGARSKRVVPKKKKLNPGKVWKNKHPHLFHEIHKDYSIGQAVQPKRHLGRMVRWPRYIRIQRQKKILIDRLKIPPPINQFSKTLEKNSAANLFSLLFKYRPETKKQKAKRLKKEAEAEKAGKDKTEKTKPVVVKFGLNHVTTLIEKKEARLVIIAHDVNPIELVIWMPALCKRMGVPYCIVKGKARLGKIVHSKTASCLALTQVKKEDQHKLEQMISSYTAMFNDSYDADRKKWGGGNLGFKARQVLRKKEIEKQKELKKMGHLLS